MFQVLSSMTYIESNNSQKTSSPSPYTLSSSSISRININDFRDHESALPINPDLQPDDQAPVSQYGKSNNNYRTSMAASKADRNDKLNNGRSFLNTKILYKQYAVNSNNNNNDDDRSFKQQNNASAPASRSKTINSTVFKTVTPSITDRVIADLKNEEYLAAQQKARENDEAGENEDAIYIDGDEDEVNTVDSILENAEHESSVERVPQDSAPVSISSQDSHDSAGKSNTLLLSKKSKQPILIGNRDKKSSNGPATISKQFKSFGFPDIVDSEESDMNDDNDDDDEDIYGVNSGSGDFASNHLVDQSSVHDWIASSANRNAAQLKQKYGKQSKTASKNAKTDYETSIDDNAYDNNGSSDEMDNDSITSDNFSNNEDDDDMQQQLISKKIARAHKKQYLLQAATKNQKQKTSSSTNSNSGSNNNNKRKSKEQRYIDEYFNNNNKNSNGAKIESSAENVEKDDDDSNSGSKNKYNVNRGISTGWMEPRIRRILGNIKKSEERSQQILLCKGEGELCSILFKTPIKPIEVQ